MPINATLRAETSHVLPTIPDGAPCTKETLALDVITLEFQQLFGPNVVQYSYDTASQIVTIPALGVATTVTIGDVQESRAAFHHFVNFVNRYVPVSLELSPFKKDINTIAVGFRARYWLNDELINEFKYATGTQLFTFEPTNAVGILWHDFLKLQSEVDDVLQII